MLLLLAITKHTTILLLRGIKTMIKGMKSDDCLTIVVRQGTYIACHALSIYHAYASGRHKHCWSKTNA